MHTYPANQVLAMLRMYDALPQHAAFVTNAMIPAVKAQVECYMGRRCRMEREAVHYFRESLMHQYHEMQAQRQLFHVQNLECVVSQDWNTITLSWTAPWASTNVSITMDVRPATDVEIDKKATESNSRLNALARIIKDFDRSDNASS